jgi:hypothetical protein
MIEFALEEVVVFVMLAVLFIVFVFERVNDLVIEVVVFLDPCRLFFELVLEIYFYILRGG